MRNVLCIGIGNLYRQDNSLGPRVADALQARKLPGVRVIEHSGEGLGLIDTWQDADAVIVIDAVCSGCTPGTLFRFNLQERPLPPRFFTYSSHTFGLAQATELARSIDELPPCFLVFGIEGECFDFGTDLSPEVGQAARKLVPVIIRAIEALQHGC